MSQLHDGSNKELTAGLPAVIYAPYPTPYQHAWNQHNHNITKSCYMNLLDVTLHIQAHVTAVRYQLSAHQVHPATHSPHTAVVQLCGTIQQLPPWLWLLTVGGCKGMGDLGPPRRRLRMRWPTGAAVTSMFTFINRSSSSCKVMIILLYAFTLPQLRPIHYC